MRNGADWSVYVNVATGYDCSDSGAPPDEAVSWGKIKPDAEMIKVFCEASIVLPIIVGETFVKNFDLACRVEENKSEKK